MSRSPDPMMLTLSCNELVLLLVTLRRRRRRRRRDVKHL